MKLFGFFNGPTFPVTQSRVERKSSEDLQMTSFSPNSSKPWTSGSLFLLNLSLHLLWEGSVEKTPLIVLQNHSCISPSPRFPIYLCCSLASRLPPAPLGTSLYQILLLDYSSRAKKKCNLACVSKAGGTLWKHPQPSAFIHTPSMSNTLSPPLYSQAPDEESLKPSLCPLNCVSLSPCRKRDGKVWNREDRETSFLLDGTVAPLKETDGHPWTKQGGGKENRGNLNEWSNTPQTRSRAIWEDGDVNENENKASELPPDDPLPFEPWLIQRQCKGGKRWTACWKITV